MRVFLVLCILALSRADLLQDILRQQKEQVIAQEKAEVAPSLISAGLTALIGRRDIDKRNFLDDLKKIGEAPTVIESALPALLAGVGKRDIERRNFLDDLKNTLKTIGENVTKEFESNRLDTDALIKEIETLPPQSTQNTLPALLAGVGKSEIEHGNFLDDLKNTFKTIGQTLVKEVETLAPTLIQNTLPALLSSVGKREIELRNFLDDLKNTLKTIGQLLAPTLLQSALPALISSVGKRRVVEAGLLEHVRDEMLSVVDKLKESVEGAVKIATNLEGNLKTASQGLTSGQDVKALAQMVLSTLEKDVDSLIEKGTFEDDIDALFQNIVPNAVEKLFSKHSRRGLLGDILSGLKDTLGDTLGLLSGTTFADLKRFLDSVKSTAEQSLTPALGNLKGLAQTFLANNGNATAQVVAEAVKFFQPFQTQLGSVFTQIKNVAEKLTGQ